MPLIWLFYCILSQVKSRLWDFMDSLYIAEYILQVFTALKELIIKSNKNCQASTKLETSSKS